MKKITSILVLAVIFLFSANLMAQTSDYQTGSVFIVTKMTNRQDSKCLSTISFMGNFARNPEGYTNQINTDQFKADFIMVYDDYILGFDYSEDWQCLDENCNEQKLVDYGNIVFAGWSDLYAKLCKLQNISTAPQPFMYIDMFYLRGGLDPLSVGPMMKIINIKTGQEKYYDSWSENIPRNTFSLQTGWSPNEGLAVGFDLNSSLCTDKLKEFFPVLK